jgi:hypothetical protein
MLSFLQKRLLQCSRFPCDITVRRKILSLKELPVRRLFSQLTSLPITHDHVVILVHVLASWNFSQSHFDTSIWNGLLRGLAQRFFRNAAR